jgi:hypothetical protein
MFYETTVDYQVFQNITIQLSSTLEEAEATVGFTKGLNMPYFSQNNRFLERVF